MILGGAFGMPTIRVNGCDFRYVLRGTGPDLVFIHGEIHGLDYWEHQIAEFSRDFRCFAYDRRGHGGSEMPAYGFSVVNQTRDLAQLLDYFQIARPVIIALAFGTTVAANFAITHPERVRGMVLAAWSELHEAMAYFARWEESGLRAAEVLETEGREALASLLHKEGGKTMFKVIPLDSPIRDKAVRLLASHPAEEYRRGMLEMASSVPNLIPQLGNLDLPVLGVCGAEDPFPDRPELLSGMKSFREAAPIEGCGRFLHWERPQEFNRLVRRFVEREV